MYKDQVPEMKQSFMDHIKTDSTNKKIINGDCPVLVVRHDGIEVHMTMAGCQQTIVKVQLAPYND
jgi:hypothetical protein